MERLMQIIRQLNSVGANCYYVGGYVRDFLLKRETYDYDIEVYNIDFSVLVKQLQNFGEVQIFEKFNVAKLRDYPQYEFAIPRIERKSGTLHTDFIVEVNPNLDKKEACKRRDFTVNALLMDCITNEVYDYYNGIKDLENKCIRHVSDRFIEDPLRVLRALRFATKLDFSIANETVELCLQMLNDLDFISNERFVSEFDDIIAYTNKNSCIYIEKILFKYLNISNYKKIEFYNAPTLRLKLILFFYMIKDNEIEHIIKRCINRKNIEKDVREIINIEITLDNIVDVFKYFKEDAIILYEIVAHIDVCDIYNIYLEIVKKYNGNYFKDKGYVKEEIKIVMDSKIKEEVNKYVYNSRG